MSRPSTALVTLTLSDKALHALRSTFPTVHYHPAGSSPPPASVLKEVEILFGPPTRLSDVKTFDELPKLKYVQLGSAGADGPLATPVLKDWVKRDESGRGGREVKMMTASGTHVLSIPPWAVGCVIMLYHQIPRMLEIAKVGHLPASLVLCMARAEPPAERTEVGKGERHRCQWVLRSVPPGPDGRDVGLWCTGEGDGEAAQESRDEGHRRQHQRQGDEPGRRESQPSTPDNPHTSQHYHI